jgi:hypothetical protein
MITEPLKQIAAAAGVGGMDRINNPNLSLLTGAKKTTRHVLSSARVSRSWQRCCCRNRGDPNEEIKNNQEPGTARENAVEIGSIQTIAKKGICSRRRSRACIQGREQTRRTGRTIAAARRSYDRADV